MSLRQGLDLFVVEDMAGRQDLVALAVNRRPAQLASDQLLRVTVADRHPVVHTAEWALDEPELVDLGVRGEVADQTDVRTLGGLDRADTAVVAVVYVPDVEARALTREAARAERREPALVRQLGQRVVLVHELRQLARPEEL